MKTKRIVISGSMALIALLLIFTSVLAASIIVDDVAVQYPDNTLKDPPVLTCDPWNFKIVKQILVKSPVGSKIEVKFAFVNPKGGDPTFTPTLIFINQLEKPLGIAVPYPEVSQWPGYDPNKNSFTIASSAMVIVTKPDGAVVKITTKKWWIECIP